ncbi:3-oxoacid CoA-transferase subunit B [Bradyrhizobium sp. 24]|uniref:3-oxoacid CoA-transferase subunit B n=1 Tax=unclassified Bradyrhizobium TaxID=2631580 RepID=UPI001FFA962C|nr:MULTISPECIES: 3-oxoacid CoA-transferase subunit B [unclassified Bradyrhizobium]MCK1298422.1 3-oxoacid CoA-transferase subunit B [Bradyrhizobium sp. 37]MCK1378219.1 3-oxoacid CoA-transferase subunit B [Bradyrhizobium sp. 24]MCK1769465.1 3-oxoacid CoA-transferase subunit B [Bradyrhizobium sp. 134]
MIPLSRDALARMVALHLPEEGFVNLGIGAPTHVADYLPAGSGVILHSENGILNVGPKPAAGQEDWDLINAGKMPISLRTGGSYFDSSLSFAMMRGGHLDVAVLGAFQVSKEGDLANWTTGDNGFPPGIGGAIDLAVGAKSIWVMMDHATKDGRSRIVERCGYPLTARRVVTRIFTSLAIIDVTGEGLMVRALLDGLTIEGLRDRTEAPLHVAGEVRTIRQEGSVA